MSYLLADITTVRQIEHYQTLLWQGVAEGKLDDACATELAEAANTKRTILLEAWERRLPPPRSYFPKRPLSGHSRSQAATGSRCSSRWARKRRLGDMAALPPHVRHKFTEGERAVLYIVAADCRQHGSCRCSIKEIGDRAGVGITTVRNALRRARILQLVDVAARPQWRAKHLTNVISIACPRWLSWLQKFRPNLGLKFYPTGCKKPKPSGTVGHKKLDGQPSYNRSDGLLRGL
ncbi:hypothetical protein CU102_24050 [Phyllobacterium brassicacearum]|uniref:Uncharacterized protein n=2 Tax=Phyllobacterium brassicacearum TaxID=314235 RepID=A0A2P7BA65_9HYPH|nr:hypothetical protein CU102_24050 [Phyllobacterium brassicacearum]